MMKRFYIIILTLTSLVCFATTIKVKRIIDGDTFETETGEKVRLIGINAPEMADIFGQEAKQHLTDLISGTTIDLQADSISKGRDRYSRLLGYVILDGKDINKQMISDGFAFAYMKFNFQKANEYKQAQLTSSQKNKGMWSNANEEKVIVWQEKNDGGSCFFSSKAYFIISVIVLLMLVGIYYYFKS